MPAGDAQRAWFPEMLEDLESRWSNEMTWEELAVFCRDMTEKRQKIKEARNIRPLRMNCNECGGQMEVPPVSIRSALFALNACSVAHPINDRALDDVLVVKRRAVVHALAWLGILGP